MPSLVMSRNLSEDRLTSHRITFTLIEGAGDFELGTTPAATFTLACEKHSTGSILNGLALHLAPAQSDRQLLTFLIFSD